MRALVYQGGSNWGKREANVYRVNYIIPDDIAVVETKEPKQEPTKEPVDTLILLDKFNSR